MTVCGPTHLTDTRSTGAALDDLRQVAPSWRGCRLRVVRLGIGDTSLFAGVEASGRTSPPRDANSPVVGASRLAADRRRA